MKDWPAATLPCAAERLGAAVGGRRVSPRARLAGSTHTPSFVGEPQCHGVIERFIRTLKEQGLWLHRFETLAEAPGIIAAFFRRYNEEWIIERLDYRTRSSPDRSWRRWPNYGDGLFPRPTISLDSLLREGE